MYVYLDLLKVLVVLGVGERDAGCFSPRRFDVKSSKDPAERRRQTLCDKCLDDNKNRFCCRVHTEGYQEAYSTHPPPPLKHYTAFFLHLEL